MKLEYRIVNSTSGLDQLKDQWMALDSETNHHNICSSYYWVYNWWKVFEKVDSNKLGFKKELVIVCGYNEHKLELVCPLMKVTRKKYGLRLTFIEFIGQQWSGVYYDIISLKHHKNMFAEVQSYVRTKLKFDFIHLRYIPALSEHYANNLCSNFTGCLEINISEFPSFEHYWKSYYSKGLKQNLRTGINRAKNENDILKKSVECLNNTNFEKIINLSKSKIIDNKVWLYGDKHKYNFYKRIHADFNSNVVFVKVNEVALAYRTNVFFNGLKLCTDASYDRNAPNYELGIHSVDENIKDSFSKKIIIHSFGPGLDPYKLRFAKNINNLKILFQKGNTMKSYFYIILKNIILSNKHD